MHLCNPDCLIDWRVVAPPKFKKDYEGKLLRVGQFARYRPDGADLPPDGAVACIERRYNNGSQFELQVSWHCPACEHPHTGYVPEAWIAEDKAQFVVPSGLADATYALGEHPAVLSGHKLQPSRCGKTGGAGKSGITVRSLAHA